MTTALRAGDQVTVEVTTRVDAETGEKLWELYHAAFEALRSHAASRHWLTRAEFELEALDERVTKYIAWRGDEPVGLCTLATDLTTVPWVSPSFYAARYPEHAARGAIFYCSLALVHPDERGSDAFVRSVSAAAQDIAAADGVLAADMCRLNTDVLGLSRTVTLLLRRAWGGARPVELDRQVFLAWEPPSLSDDVDLPKPRRHEETP